MSMTLNRALRAISKLLIATFTVLLAISIGTTNANAYAGTLENGNLAYAAGSGFDKGEACNYLPGFETGYDAWHFVLTARGATFQQDPRNPAIAINLNFVFMRQDGTLFTIRSGAWVQTGKGAYTYTPVADRIRMVQAGTLAQINGLDSGMRLSHTCPGTGSAVTPTTTPTPTVTPTASPTATPTPTPSTSSTPTPTPTPTTSSSPTPTPSASASPSPSVTPTPTPTPSATTIPTLRPRPNPTASAIQVHPTGTRSPLPTPSPTPQGINDPTPSPTPTPSASPSRTPTPTASPTASPTPTEPTNTPPPVVPTPPPVEDPKNVEYVEPKTPANIDPQNFPEPPAAPVVVTQQPTYGTLKTNTDGTFTYTPPAVIPAIPVVDVVEFKYTNISGKAVTVRKEFVLTVKGDVPSIIQTGGESEPRTTSYRFIAVLLATTLIVIRRLTSTKKVHTHA